MNESFNANEKQKVTPENVIGVMQTLSGMPTNISIEGSDAGKKIIGDVDGYEIKITENPNGNFELEIDGQTVTRPELFQAYGKEILSKADEIYQAESLEKTREAERFLQALNLDLFPPIELEVLEDKGLTTYSMIIEGRSVVVSDGNDQVAMRVNDVDVRNDIYAREIRNFIGKIK